MALTTFKYNDRMYVKNKNGSKVYGGIRWREDNNQLISMPSGFFLSLTPNASSASDPMEEITLFEYSNGVVLKFSYRMIVTPSMNYDTYSLSSRWNYYDKDGNVLLTGGGPGGNRNRFPQNPRAPFETCIFSPAVTFYNTNNPTMPDEDAAQLWISCLFDLKHDVLVPADFTDVQTFGIFSASWNYTIFNICNSDADYMNWLGRIVGGGDGTNPSGKDDGSGGGGDEPAGSDDTSEPGGGDGNYEDDSDPIDFPPLPTGGALESGAINAHIVTTNDLQNLMGQLWSRNIIDQWLHSIEDPMQAIVSLHALPVEPETTLPTKIWIGNYDTDLSTNTVSEEYVIIDCGSISTREFWGSALDYSPYTKMSVFLPFIGIKELKIEDTMKTTIHIKYYVDVLTGDCVAFIKCGQSVLYHYTGNCRMSIPLSSYSSDILTNIIKAQGGMALAAGMVSAGVAAPVVGAGMAISSATNVANTKKNISRSGDISGNAGIMDDFVPYLIIHRPVQSLAKDYNKFKGYPSNITSLLGECTGYTEVEHIHLQSIPNATEAEMNEIERLLKEGVLI